MGTQERALEGAVLSYMDSRVESECGRKGGGVLFTELGKGRSGLEGRE